MLKPLLGHDNVIPLNRDRASMLPEAIRQATHELEPCPPKILAEMIEMTFLTLGISLPPAEGLIAYYSILGEYPEDLIRSATRELLRRHYGVRPVPADWCRHMEEERRHRETALKTLMHWNTEMTRLKAKRATAEKERQEIVPPHSAAVYFEKILTAIRTSK